MVGQPQLSQENLNSIFGLYRTITRSHWKDLKILEVMFALTSTGTFAFVAGPKETWATRFVIKTNGEHLDFCIEINPNLPKALQTHADTYVARFKTGLLRLGL